MRLFEPAPKQMPGQTIMGDGMTEETMQAMLDAATTREAAQDAAIEWQSWFSERSMSQGELLDWQAQLEALGLRFDLTDEFRENGLI